MKTRRSCASISSRGSSRLRAQGGECVCVSIDTPQLIGFPEGSPLRILHESIGQLSRAMRNTKSRLYPLWRNALERLSHAGMRAKASISHSWKYIRTQQVARSSCKRLQVAETVSLGEKRFVAVIRVDGREFLVGGGATNVALLTQLDAKPSFDNLLTETMTVPKKRPAKRARKQIAKPPVEQAGGQA